ncbi:MAG: 1,4-dihydroxy-2-naphthoate octaprenyltransferase [Flavobacteriaceae bacterium]
MLKIPAWLKAARLRTLPLSVSGIIMGTALANFYGESDIQIFILALLTTIGLQITSNFANDYGDGVKGTDNLNRVGPKRTLQSGLLSRRELKKGILISVVINILLIISLVYVAFGSQDLIYFAIFIGLGLVSVWAAIKYTVGRSAYGYRGYGDIFVFLFFGLIAVVGSMFLYTKQLSLAAFLPACSIGFLSTGVLNLNNLRDHQNDKMSNKNTLVVQMGYAMGKRYHALLLIAAFVCALLYVIINFSSWVQCIPLLIFIPVSMHLSKVFGTKKPEELDPELKKLALNTFFLAVLFFIVYNNFL